MGQLARDYGFKLADLNETQQRLLAAYWMLCDSCPPSRDEEMPLEYAPALLELSKIAGKFKPTPKAHRDYRVRGNKGRQIRHSRGNGALATSPGGR